LADGYDFAELTHYSLGEDAKKIDWKSTAKTNSTKINVFNIDKELNIVVVLHSSTY
jgi:uncharacterized protein (DUF58 family)